MGTVWVCGVSQGQVRLGQWWRHFLPALGIGLLILGLIVVAVALVAIVAATAGTGDAGRGSAPTASGAP
ncbi:MAG: hypothetical protein GEU81_18485, partial [Nitriliruptorales bacterium]|nr:hypothetical protein [Nitriliruptorales bacterium]